MSILSDRHDPEEEPPPFLGSWRRIYTAIILYLIALIFVFYLFTNTFNH